MKKSLFIFFLFLGINNAIAQHSNEWKLAVGFNRMFLTEKAQLNGLLADFTTIVDLNYKNSNVTVGSNFGIQRVFSVSKNRQWRIITGIQYQDFAYEVNSYSDALDSRLIFNSSNKVSQWDIPLLVSYITSKGKFSFGADVGIFQTVFVTGEYWSKTTQDPVLNPQFVGESLPFSGSFFVTQPLRKMSAYLAPFARVDLTDWLAFEVQPFLRYQRGGSALGFSYHSSNNNPAFGQWGVNAGMVFKFGNR